MDETLIQRFSALTLTNIRLRQRYSNQVKSALLSEIDGAAVVYYSNPVWLIVGVLVLLFGLIGTVASDSAALLILGLVVGGSLIAMYFLSRQVVFVVHAGELQLREALQGNALDQAVAFIDAIELAKLNAEKGD